MTLRREVVLAIIALALVAGLSIAGSLISARRNAEAEAQTAPAGSTHSTAPYGSQALFDWLEALSVAPRRIEGDAFRIPDNTRLLFVIDPGEFPAQDFTELDRWVRAGGTLVLSDVIEQEVLTRFGASRDRVFGNDQTAQAVAPAFLNPPVTTLIAPINTTLKAAEAATLFTSPSGGSVLMVQQRGQGRVYLLSMPALLTNEYLGQGENPKLVLNWLTQAGVGPGQVAIDEYHHGYREEPDLRRAILTSPWGWALVYGLVVGFVYFALRGRRLGPALPLSTGPGRAASEFVQALANLLRKGRQRAFLQQHYARQARLWLAARLGQPPDAPVESLLTVLQARRPADAARIAEPLRALNGPPLPESTLLKNVAAVTQWQRDWEKR